MLGKLILIFVTIGSIYLGNELSNVYVSEQFENPIFYKLIFLSVKTIGKIAQIAEYLNIENEYLVLRNGLDALTKKEQLNDENYMVYDTHYNNVPVRVYSPKLINKPMPFMVYTHGGGYTFGNLDSFDLYLFEIAKQSNIVIISVELSPEFAYPIPLDDSFLALEYAIENSKQLNLDVNNLIIGGDSSGGNAALALSQRLFERKQKKAKFQILIYPWIQSLNLRFPTRLQYHSGIVSTVNSAKIILWYLGYSRVSQAMQDFLLSNKHLYLIKDEEVKKKYQSFMDINLIPEKYKTNKQYYQNYDNTLFKNDTLDDQLLNDKIFIDRVMKLFDKDVSPGLADINVLKNMPKTYMLVFEWDALKDEQLIYVERLKSANVDVYLNFNEIGFHGISPMIDKSVGLKLPILLLEDLVNFIKYNINKDF